MHCKGSFLKFTEHDILEYLYSAFLHAGSRNHSKHIAILIIYGTVDKWIIKIKR